MKHFACRITGIDTFVGHVHRIMLQLPADTLAEFSPGQYLSLHIEGMEPAFFSIANLPGSRELELHIDAPPGRDAATRIFSCLRQNPVVEVSMPYGKACLSALYDNIGAGGSLENTSIILIAAGTGFAQIKSIARFLFQASDKPASIHLFWGGKTADDLYSLSEPRRWQDEVSNFHFHQVTTDGSAADTEPQQHHHQLVSKVTAQPIDFTSAIVFASGSPDLVYSVLDSLLAIGLKEDCFYSDVLEYAPRN